MQKKHDESTRSKRQAPRRSSREAKFFESSSSVISDGSRDEVDRERIQACSGGNAFRTEDVERAISGVLPDVQGSKLVKALSRKRKTEHRKGIERIREQRRLEVELENKRAVNKRFRS